MTNIVLADADRAVLAAVAAGAEPPGTVLRDFDTLLAFLGTDGVPVSPKECELAISCLPQLNARLTRPAPIGLSRGRQVSYPHVDGLRMLLLVSRLGKVDRTRTTPRVVLDTALLARWRSLNLTERYFILLERWWSLSNVYEGRTELQALSMAEYRRDFLRGLGRGSTAREREPGSHGVLCRLLGMKQIALLQLFGMLDIQSCRAVAGEGWKISRMTSTPWGLAATRTYLQAFRSTSLGMLEHLLDLPDDDASEPDAAADSEVETADEVARPAFHWWADAVIPFFPAWQHGLGEPEPAEPFRGSCTLKVSLGERAWRRIVISGDSSFDDLALFLLRAFRFDDEYLYEFRYRDQYAALRTLSDPRYDQADDEYADAVTLGEAGLFAKQVLEFHYGFGSDWRFQVLVEKLDTSKPAGKPVVIASEGKAPRQYR